MKNYYAILGIEPTAKDEEIKKAYKDLSKQYHPDKAASNNWSEQQIKENETKFYEIKEAYDTLMNPLKRKIYDMNLKTGEDKINDKLATIINIIDNAMHSSLGMTVTKFYDCVIDLLQKDEKQLTNVMDVLENSIKILKDIQKSCKKKKKKASDTQILFLEASNINLQKYENELKIQKSFLTMIREFIVFFKKLYIEND